MLPVPTTRYCRALFAKKLGQDIDWGEGWEKEDWVHKFERFDDYDE